MNLVPTLSIRAEPNGWAHHDGRSRSLSGGSMPCSWHRHHGLANAARRESGRSLPDVHRQSQPGSGVSEFRRGQPRAA
jgi:hypothetical protein